MPWPEKAICDWPTKYCSRTCQATQFGSKLAVSNLVSASRLGQRLTRRLILEPQALLLEIQTKYLDFCWAEVVVVWSQFAVAPW
jgi:hypothetical protein